MVQVLLQRSLLFSSYRDVINAFMHRPGVRSGAVGALVPAYPLRCHSGAAPTPRPNYVTALPCAIYDRFD